MKKFNELFNKIINESITDQMIGPFNINLNSAPEDQTFMVNKNQAFQLTNWLLKNTYLQYSQPRIRLLDGKEFSPRPDTKFLNAIQKCVKRNIKVHLHIGFNYGIRHGFNLCLYFPITYRKYCEYMNEIK